MIFLDADQRFRYFQAMSKTKIKDGSKKSVLKLYDGQELYLYVTQYGVVQSIEDTITVVHIGMDNFGVFAKLVSANSMGITTVRNMPNALATAYRYRPVIVVPPDVFVERTVREIPGGRRLQSNAIGCWVFTQGDVRIGPATQVSRMPGFTEAQDKLEWEAVDV